MKRALVVLLAFSLAACGGDRSRLDGSPDAGKVGVSFVVPGGGFVPPTRNSTSGGGAGLSGGTTNQIPIWTSSSTLGNSQISDNGTTVSMGALSLTGAGTQIATTGNEQFGNGATDVVSVTGSLSINGVASPQISTTTGVAFGGAATADGGDRVFDLVGAGLARDGTSANQIDLSMTGGTCSAGDVATALSSTGALTCTAIGTQGGTTGTGTANTLPKWTGTTSLGAANISDNGVTLTISDSALTLATAGTDTVTFGNGASDLVKVTGSLQINGGAPTQLSTTGPVSFGGTVVLNQTSGTTAIDGAATFGSTALFSGNVTMTGGKVHVIDTDTSNRPTASACGTSPTVVGDDNNGYVIVGTGGSSSCTITFHVAFTNGSCLLDTPSSGTKGSYTSPPITSSVTYTAALGSGQKLVYDCHDH